MTALAPLLADLRSEETRSVTIKPSALMTTWCNEFEQRLTDLPAEERAKWVARVMEAGVAVRFDTNIRKAGPICAWRHPTTELRLVLQELRVAQGVPIKDAIA
jgi:ligand-binding SRPBCC domain-containing protein